MRPDIRERASAPEVVTALVQHHRNLKTVFFTAYIPRPPIEERLAHDSALQPLLERLRAFSQKASLDLAWEELAVAAAFQSENLDRALRETGAHSAVGEGEGFALPAAEVRTDRLQTMIQEVNTRGKVLAVCSRCLLTTGAVAHIPMMDFRCKILGENLARIKLAVSSIAGEPGVLLTSGRSYHWYGYGLMEQEEWVTFLSTCLLYAPLVDARYIAHRLKERNAVLRISNGGIKPETPSVVGFTEAAKRAAKGLD